MQKISNKWLYMLLATGLLFILAGFFLWIAFSSAADGIVKKTWPLLIIGLGFFFFFSTLAIKRNSIFFFWGFFLSLSGFILLLITMEVIHFGILKLWPVFGIIAGVDIILLSYFKKRMFSISNLLSGFAVIVICCVFLPFSLGIASISFKAFVIIAFPVLLVIGGVSLVALFVAQMYNKKLVLPEEESDDSDEII
ncbi:MAG: hypothetical protein MJ176_05105 [Treponema sp.]|nr:hypothetical protein [Treponema sp.]